MRSDKGLNYDGDRRTKKDKYLGGNVEVASRTATFRLLEGHREGRDSGFSLGLG